MASTRLNRKMRDELLVIAKNEIKVSETSVIEAEKVFFKAFTNLLRETYPQKDMKVLQKYGLAGEGLTRFEVEVKDDTDRYNYDYFTYDAKAKQLPTLLPSQRRRMRLENDVAKLYWAWKHALRDVAKERDERYQAFKTLVTCAVNLEQVEAAWPSARKVRGYTANLPAVAIGPLQDQVKAILERMKA
jgi:hypothetical protein